MLHNPGYSALPRPRAPRCVAILALFSSFSSRPPSLSFSGSSFLCPFALILPASVPSVTHTSHFLLFLLYITFLPHSLLPGTALLPLPSLSPLVLLYESPSSFSLFPLLQVRLEVDFLMLCVPISVAAFL